MVSRTHPTVPIFGDFGFIRDSNGAHSHLNIEGSTRRNPTSDSLCSISSLWGFCTSTIFGLQTRLRGCKVGVKIVLLRPMTCVKPPKILLVYLPVKMLRSDRWKKVNKVGMVVIHAGPKPVWCVNLWPFPIRPMLSLSANRQLYSVYF